MDDDHLPRSRWSPSALHLAHGIFSAQQTLGWTGTPAGYRRAKAIGYGLAAVIAVGFIIPPLAILFGLIK